MLVLIAHAKRATRPARTPAAPRTSSPPRRLCPLAVFVLCALVADALDEAPLPLPERLDVLVTKLLTREVAVDDAASSSVAVAVPEIVVTPTDSTDAVGTLLVKVAESCRTPEAVETSVACPFASVVTSLLDWPRTKPVLEAIVFPPLMIRI